MDVKRDIVVEGHRGYCAVFPENTMISYEAAMDLGVDAVEFDIRLTKDKVPVLMHDGNAKRTCDVDVNIDELTLEEVKQKLSPAYTKKFGNKYVQCGLTVPTFEELCALAAKKRPDIHMGTELKISTKETADLAVAILKKYGLFENAYFYLWDTCIVEYIKTKYGGRTMGYLKHSMKYHGKDPYRYYDDIGLSMSQVKSIFYPLYVRRGFPVHMFCADTEKDVRFFLSKKECGLITANDPVPLMKVLGREIGKVKGAEEWTSKN